MDRIWIDPSRVEDVEAAITRKDVKKLINDGVIRVKPEHGIAGYSSKVRQKQRVKGRSRGHGKRKGSKNARSNSKEEWMNRIRKIRRYLRSLRDRKLIDRRTYRRLYMLAKGGQFSSLASLKLYLKENNILREVR